MPPPPQATSLQDPTSYRPHLATGTIKPTPTHHVESFFGDSRLDGIAASTTMNANSQKSRAIIWPTPNVALNDVPTTFVTITASTQSVEPTHDVKPLTAGNTVQPTTAATPAHPPFLVPSEAGLPDWPPILTIFLLSWLVMAWIVAATLFVASFPDKISQVDGLYDRVLRWKKLFKRNRTRDGFDEEQFYNGGDYRERMRYGDALRQSSCPNTIDGSTASRNAREDISTAVASGLGISLKDLPPRTPRMRRPRSFDEDSLKLHRRSSHTSVPSTAPLLASRSSIALTPPALRSRREDDESPVRIRAKDLESGRRDVDARDIITEAHKQTLGESSGLVGVLESVQAVIEFAAGKLAKIASDVVADRPEEGLLLPVRNEEREPRAVAVD